MMNYVNIWVQQPNSLLCRLISSYTNVQNELGLASTVCPFTQDVLFIVLYRYDPSEDLFSLLRILSAIFWRSKMLTRNKCFNKKYRELEGCSARSTTVWQPNQDLRSVNWREFALKLFRIQSHPTLCHIIPIELSYRKVFCYFNSKLLER